MSLSNMTVKRIQPYPGSQVIVFVMPTKLISFCLSTNPEMINPWLSKIDTTRAMSISYIAVAKFDLSEIRIANTIIVPILIPDITAIAPFQ